MLLWRERCQRTEDNSPLASFTHLPGCGSPSAVEVLMPKTGLSPANPPRPAPSPERLIGLERWETKATKRQLTQSSVGSLQVNFTARKECKLQAEFLPITGQKELRSGIQETGSHHWSDSDGNIVTSSLLSEEEITALKKTKGVGLMVTWLWLCQGSDGNFRRK